MWPVFGISFQNLSEGAGIGVLDECDGNLGVPPSDAGDTGSDQVEISPVREDVDAFNPHRAGGLHAG
jgi:hypothetical protein